jgi:hypothetical protein
MGKTFEIKSGKMVVSDPCYTTNPPTWCQTILENVKNGTWVASVEIKDFGGWGERVHWLYATHTSNERGVKSEIGNLGVDSGQLGFFDSEFYRNDDMATDLPKSDFGENYDRESGDSWYRSVCNLTLSDEQWGVMSMGVVSTSGIGDSSYYGEVERNEMGEVVSIIVYFLSDEDDEDDEDSYPTFDEGEE